MRKKFEQQIAIGQKIIQDIHVNLKCRDAFTKLVLSLKEIFITPEYNEVIFSILEKKLCSDKKKTGRTGMDLWQIFVLAQTRLALNISYDRLHHMANFDTLLRQLLGIEKDYGYEKIELEYQNIIDNVHLLDDDLLRQINEVIVKMGHDVFKKKEEEALHLKTDSYVVESNVHFPTDYNLLWDSTRKCIDVIESFLNKYNEIPGWRNLQYWFREIKNHMRNLSQAAKKSAEKRKSIAEQYLNKAKLFAKKIENPLQVFPLESEKDLSLHLELEYYKDMLDKHIDLVERRLIKGEEIPHSDKIFSIFETYTEWINKGKQHPNVELGKNLQLTSDQFDLIIDYKIMEHEVDKSLVIPLVDRILSKFIVSSWSFDKGFYTKDNKELLKLFINNLVMPKKGRLNLIEKEEESTKIFKKFRNKHSAVESNINSLEKKGLDRCPDKGYQHFKNYIGVGICAYNLHRIGAELMKQQIQKLALKIAA